MKVVYRFNELTVLNDTLNAHKNGTTRNRDIAFLALELYKMIPPQQINKKKYIDLLSCIVAPQHSNTLYTNIEKLIQTNNCSQDQLTKELDDCQKYLTIKHAIKAHVPMHGQHKKHHVQIRQKRFEAKYWHKLEAFISRFVGFRAEEAFEWNVIKLCCKYTDQIFSHMTVPKASTPPATDVLSVLIYLYTHKTTDYFSKTTADQNDGEQCDRINASATNSRHLNIIPSVDGKLFVCCLSEQFHADCSDVSRWRSIRHRQSAHEICVSLFEYLMRSEADPKKWNFCYYFIKFLHENELDIYADHSVTKKSLGLFFQREICTRYNLKYAPYTKVKKVINQWCYDTFSPTIYGWWHWYNQTLNRWIPFPMQLKMYFKIFNAAYGDDKQHDVYTMDCHFKVVRRTRQNFQMQTQSDAIPICIHERQVNNIRHRPPLPNASSGYSAYRPSVQNEAASISQNRGCLVLLFVNRLICSYIGSDGVSEDITNVIGKYIYKTPARHKNIGSVARTPFAVLCCLYNFENSDATIYKITNSLQQREVLTSDGLLNPMQMLGVITVIRGTQNMDMYIQLLLAALLSQYFCDIEVLKNTPFCHYTRKQICLALLRDIVSTTKCDKHSYQFIVLFFKYIKQNSIAMRSFEHTMDINCASSIVKAVCEYYQIQASNYKNMSSVLSNCLINLRK